MRAILRYAAAAVLASTLLPAPAARAAAPVELDLTVPGATFPLDREQWEYRIYARLSAPAKKVTYTLDLSRALDVVTYPAGQNGCTRTGHVLTCTKTDNFPADTTAVIAVLWLGRAPGATVGATGTLSVTARADGGPAATGTAHLRLGGPVDLAAAPAYTFLRIEPGATGSSRPGVANVGDATVDGAVLHLAVPDDLVTGQRFANCAYGLRIVCRFDEALEPGTTYRIDHDLEFRVPADVARGSRTESRIEWQTPAEWADLGIPDGTPGDGPVLALEPAVATRAQADVRPWDNYGLFDIIAGDLSDRDTDLSVVSDTVRGAAGDEVPVTIGVVNNGPGTMYRELFSRATSPISVWLPDGVTVVRAAPGCRVDAPRRQTMTCDAQPPVWGPGTLTYPFTVRIGPKATGDDGWISINNGPEPANYADIHRGNEAYLVITVGPGGATGGGAGGGGGLPVTGPDAGWTALAGAVCVLLGFVLVRAGRRRVVHR